MIKYTIKRLLQSLVTVLIVATIVFLLMRMLPTDYFFTEDQLMKLTEEQKIDQLTAAGLMDPIPEQLADFYGQLVRFDFGESRRIQSGADVLTVIGSKFTVSMRLGCTSLVVALIIGVAMGIVQTLNKDRVLDHIGTAFTIFVNAVPSLVSYSLIWFQGFRFTILVFNKKPWIIKYLTDCLSCISINCFICTLDKTLHGRRIKQRLY